MNSLSSLLPEIEQFRATIAQQPVAAPVSPDLIRAHIADHFPFSHPQPLESVIAEVVQMMHDWSLHTTHPRYFGLFNPNVTEAAIAADTLAALYNPQLATWSHAPAANEIERHTLQFFLRQFGFDPAESAAHFTSGGAEANHTALITALTHRFPAYGNEGVRSLPAQPVFYVSEQAHHSFQKAAHSTGLGRAAVRTIPVNEALQMDCATLERQIQSDIAEGFIPFMTAGTVGTTPAGVIDPLEEISRICRQYGLWFHADGAWGGAAIISPRAAQHLRGIDQADSIACDAHKWLSVSMSAGMFFCRHRHAVGDAFRITASYMPEHVQDTADNYAMSLQWSRRFIGLKVFMTLAERGAEGLAQMVDEEIALGRYMRGELEKSGWTIVNETPLPVICFTHASLQNGAVAVNDVLQRIYAEGSAWISSVTVPHYGNVLRTCIINYATTQADVDGLVASLKRFI
ncbi:MAG: pyridoxal phosphate-dependent decarboxylase family protein [Acidobacteriota bacterium]